MRQWLITLAVNPTLLDCWYVNVWKTIVGIWGCKGHYMEPIIMWQHVVPVAVKQSNYTLWADSITDYSNITVLLQTLSSEMDYNFNPGLSNVGSGSGYYFPSGHMDQLNGDLMLAHRLRRWPNIRPTLYQCLGNVDQPEILSTCKDNTLNK